MRLYAVLIALLVLSGAAAAQPGPEPGFATAIDYAEAYAEDRVKNASGDPEGFAGGYDSPEEIADEATHAAYMVCWAADDADVQAPACDAFYTPRGEAAPEQPEEVHDVEELEESAVNATETFADEAADAVNDTVADPASAPGQVERVLDAAQDFLGSIGDAVGDFADAITGGLIACIDGIVAGIEGIERLGITSADTLVSGLEGALDGLSTGAAATTDGIAEGGDLLGDGIGSALQATGDGIASASSAVGHAITDGAAATGDGIATAAETVGDGIADAARHVKATVTGWFGAGSDADSMPQSDLDTPVDVDDSTGGLLDDVTGLLA